MTKLILFFALTIAAAAATLPVTPAESLSGKKLEFPTALEGKTAVCVFGFTKEAGDRTKDWMIHLTQDGVNAWSVADLEKAPALVRGMIRGSMRKGVPPERQDHSLVLTKNFKALEEALGVKQENEPVVAIFNSSGQVVWTHEGQFDPKAYEEVKQHLEAAR